ncbi:hypothetical protein QO002_006010 [Pararhizobium capsulatum DSM 1112]|uniref:Uncharacterized protein n=1 Tax=Pararhizobium capsulatum DSM 1112 TaxID=1121113 RepID=A0ABU0BZW3_9HYPH|nr:hypothetical protein [Pararhizobium capsulatum]MDQ0323803.1 hypothetical protein [Pararhizobium capsulatum DSM 1112]
MEHIWPARATALFGHGELLDRIWGAEKLSDEVSGIGHAGLTLNRAGAIVTKA